MPTRRRREALKVLKNLNSLKGPVGYEDVAEELGISKWSAYELLVQLEKEGLVTSMLFKRDGKLGGRPSLRFILSPQGEEYLRDSPEATWEKLKEEIGRYFEMAAKDIKRTVQTLRKEIATAASPLIESARSLTMLLLELRSRYPSLYSRIRKALNNSDNLSLISGAIMASDEGGRFSRIIKRCQRALSHLSGTQKDLLASLLREQGKVLEG